MHQLARYTSLRVFAVVILLLTAQWAYAATLTVTSISDSGSGSLRQGEAPESRPSERRLGVRLAPWLSRLIGPRTGATFGRPQLTR